MRLIDADKGLISKIQLKTGCNFITAQEIVDSMPTIEERKVGKWVENYDRGYTQAIADYRKFERFFNSEGIEVFEDIRNTDGTISIDMILQYLPMPEIMARIKAYEEKKLDKYQEMRVQEDWWNAPYKGVEKMFKLTEENLKKFFWGHEEFYLTDEDIEKLKKGKKLFGQVQDEYSFSIQYKEGKNE